MSDQQTTHETLLSNLEQHLVAERYCVHIRNRYLAVAANFLRFLDRRRICVEASRPKDISAYLRCELQRFRLDSVNCMSGLRQLSWPVGGSNCRCSWIHSCRSVVIVVG